MRHDPDAPAVPTRGTTVLRVSQGYRTGFVLVALFFLGAFSRVAWTGPWTTASSWSVAAMVALAALSCWGAVVAQRSAVWVDDERLLVCRRLVRRVWTHRIGPTTTVRSVGPTTELSNPGGAARRLTILTEGQRPMLLSAPWIPSTAEMAVLLRPALERFPALPADDDTRRLIEGSVPA